MKTCTIESSSEINLWLTSKTKICKIFSTCGRAMWIHYPKEGVADDDLDNYEQNFIPETYETCIVNDVLETKPSEALE